MEEIWKPIEGYPGYQISNYGNIISNRRNINNPTRIEPKGSSKYERPYIYLTTGKHKGKQQRGKKPRYIIGHEHIERLVAVAFVPNHRNYSDIRHIDGDIKNNRSDNLEWCKHTTDPRRNARSVIQRDLNGNVLNTYQNATEAARAIYGAPDCIRSCCNGKRETSYGFKWEWGVFND